VSGQVTRIDAKELKASLHDGGEIALLDAREELPFGRRHLLMASCVPLSRLELLVDDLVPRRATRVVWCDDNEGLAARAAARMAALGYRNVALLDGGIAAWEAAGFRIYSTHSELVSGVARLRYTGLPDLLPVEVTGMDKGIRLRFDVALDPSKAEDIGNYIVERWNYRRTFRYGSPHYKPEGGYGQSRLRLSGAGGQRAGQQQSEDGEIADSWHEASPGFFWLCRTLSLIWRRRPRPRGGPPRRRFRCGAAKKFQELARRYATLCG